MSIKFHLMPKFTAIATAVICMLLQVNTAFSEDQPSAMEIAADDKVIYCSVDRVDISDQAILALNQGTPVAFVWEIIIEEVSDYWINKNIGKLRVARQAIPDLISKSLIISDAQNGISRRVDTIDEAIEFLSSLDRFPILDRSLLEAGINYNIKVTFHIQEGQFSDSWWSDSTHFGTTIAEAEFILP
jgi:hypothetical protein